MMFAQTAELNVLDDDHIIIFHVKDGVVNELNRVGTITAQQFTVHFGDAVGRIEQPFTVWVFPDGCQDFGGGVLNAFATALETPTYLHQVLADITQAQAMGLQGVPAMIFAGKYLVSGAQPYEVLAKVVGDVEARLSAKA
jgi:hypothetical protein